MQTVTPCNPNVLPTVTMDVLATVVNSANWLSRAEQLLVYSTVDCYVIVGPEVVATATNGMILPRLTPMFIDTREVSTTGVPWRVSVIRTDTDGKFYATPCNNRSR